MKQSIQTQIENMFPNVQITQLNIIGDPDRSTINIQFSYIINSSKEIDEILLKIQNT